MIIDVLLWTWLFVMSAGTIWTLVMEQSWHSYRWLLAGLALLTLLLLRVRTWRRNRMKAQGLGHIVEQMNLEDSRKRYPNLWRILPSLEAVVWSQLATFTIIVAGH